MLPKTCNVEYQRKRIQDVFNLRQEDKAEQQKTGRNISMINERKRAFRFTVINYPHVINASCQAIHYYLITNMKNGRVSTSQKMINSQTGLSKRTIQQSIKLLIEFGIVQKKRRGFVNKLKNKRAMSVYYLPKYDEVLNFQNSKQKEIEEKYESVLSKFRVKPEAETPRLPPENLQ